MEKNIELMGNESAKFVFLRREKLRLAELQRIPKPEKESIDQSFMIGIKKVLEEERDLVLRNVVSASCRDVQDSYSLPLFQAAVSKRYRPQGARLAELDSLIAGLPRLEALIEEQDYSLKVGEWSCRMNGLNQILSEMETKLPKPFEHTKINVDPNYPSDRCTMVDNKWVDVWLTKYLNSKRPIFFEPYSTWSEKMEEFYEKVYLVEWQKAQDLLHVPVAAKPEPPPPFPPEQVVPIRAFLEEGQSEYPEQGTLKSRIYKKIGR
ncbi:MAG: hypothetical protein ABSH06_14270 [Thermodesulfobacteriota bacterium]